ncbi:cobaltochelatase subunit CobN [Acetobacterium paludosum]|uniref:Cobaltochelatase subunit CobN n=1 Tax=Acetobacterium paludosum TaxID=52693 RepID=A0A923HVE4_9FIRM|nr:cobaltochelatase subunit CobN [Acetobacterium paludosum]MBC3887892.1 cobaltochelatase subunit CobN [Acetobacterium paludosum]
MYRIAFIHSPMDHSYHMKEAAQLLEKEEKNINTVFINSFRMDNSAQEKQEAMEKLEMSDFIFIFIHGGLTQFKSFAAVMENYENKKRFFIWSGYDDENQLVLKKSGISMLEYQEIQKYAMDTCPPNCLNLLKYLGAYYGKLKITYDEPKCSQWEGIYYPGKERTIEAALREAKESGKPVVGILFYSRLIHENNLEHIDALIKEVENQGGYPLAVYSSSAPKPTIGCRGFQWVVDHVFTAVGKNNVDVIINTMSHSQSILSDPGDGSKTVEKSIYEAIDVPVIKALSTYQTYEDWYDNLRGIDAMSFPGSVYYPEFDGQIISFTFAYSTVIRDEIGEKTINQPIPDRVRNLCELALNWANLAHTENKDKKVAILFHNMPPRNDMIGCAFGLDTPQSVFDMVTALKADGITTEYDFESGDEIIQKIINAVSNDTRWLSAEQSLQRSVAIIEKEDYQHWFDQLEMKNREALKRDWGNPPGEQMVFRDQMPVPGILNGNIFIGLQPARGYEEKAEAVYHSTDIVPPHQYIAFYKWIKYAFKADVIVHVGTHGTLEWLPGKEIGLSAECYPDIAISNIPHLYPYNITVEGEGIQAKRRSDAVLLDHLIPSLTLSGSYDEMEELDDLIKQYYRAKRTDQGKMKFVQENIERIVVEQAYLTDLNISVEVMKSDFFGFIEKLHTWVEDIKNTLIKDGLHIFGKAPEGEKLYQLVCALMRLPNARVPSLTQATCRARGYDYKRLKDEPQAVDDQGMTNLMKFNEVEEISRELVKVFFKRAYQPTFIYDKQLIYFPEADRSDLEELEAVFNFIKETVGPKLNATTDEMKYLVHGVDGKFVPPGGSGAPTRGKVSILPTGRNFYAIDPSAVPTRAAWEVGKQLGQQMIDRYVKDENKYPESMVIVVYAGETMKTSGDDIAEIYYLLGIKPIWLENSDKVIGLAVIPIAELGRPRVDVTLRISGLFRDTFPNLIESVEEAVNLVAGLDESDEDNYIKRNFQNEVRALIHNGASIETAQEEAGMRIFSDPPGTYGAGVTQLINSKNWGNYTDLGNSYTFWGGHAYGKKVHGKRVTEVFARRLAKAQITVKNESSMEIDMLESDDFYNYHGGLIAAVRTKSGEKPHSYCGDSSDPARVKLNNVNEQTAKIMRSRILNPKWFDGLKEHGYKGAQEISGMVDFVFGWDATSDIVEDWMYEKISANFLFNDERREWIKSVNPWAIQNMTERLLEAAQRGMWEAKEESLEKLRTLYLEIEGDMETFSE